MKRKPPPDTRLDWRSPAMPVLRDYTMRDGSRKTLVDPQYEHDFREFLMSTTSHPDYKHDPTYHMRKDKPQ